MFTDLDFIADILIGIFLVVLFQFCRKIFFETKALRHLVDNTNSLIYDIHIKNKMLTVSLKYNSYVNIKNMDELIYKQEFTEEERKYIKDHYPNFYESN